MLLYLGAGARPNFMKIAPIVRALQARQGSPGALSYKIVHTGQHYDRDMNAVFFEELGIPQPDIVMAGGGGSHAEQTARIMIAFEALCGSERPDAVLVVGDVNSTLACSVVAKKMNIPVAHVDVPPERGDDLTEGPAGVAQAVRVPEDQHGGHGGQDENGPDGQHFGDHVAIPSALEDPWRTAAEGGQAAAAGGARVPHRPATA